MCASTGGASGKTAFRVRGRFSHNAFPASLFWWKRKEKISASKDFYLKFNSKASKPQFMLKLNVQRIIWYTYFSLRVFILFIMDIKTFFFLKNLPPPFCLNGEYFFSRRRNVYMLRKNDGERNLLKILKNGFDHLIFHYFMQTK